MLYNNTKKFWTGDGDFTYPASDYASVRLYVQR